MRDEWMIVSRAKHPHPGSLQTGEGVRASGIRVIYHPFVFRPSSLDLSSLISHPCYEYASGELSECQ